MKKVLLSGAIVFAISSIASAQTRLSLLEKFTGENCPPCASTNPIVEALVTNPGNESKIMLINYQVNIPSAGPIYNENSVEPSNRRTYYGVTSAPNARLDGKTSNFGDGAGHPAGLTQANIDAAAGIVAPFNIAISGVSISGGSVTANVTVTANSALVSANLKLRVALVETLDFASPPGTNGETHFPNVVRKMYPSPDGQDMNDSWTAGGTQTLSVSGAIPSYVNTSNEHYLVVWVQNDDDKTILNAARTYAALDIRTGGITLADPFVLTCGVPHTVTPTTKIVNNGTTTVTSATIYYKTGESATWMSQNWTGSLSTGASANVTLGPLTFSNPGLAIVMDSIAKPNGIADQFASNNTSRAGKNILKNSGGAALDIYSTFETPDHGWVPYRDAATNASFGVGTATGAGYDGSSGVLFYNCYQYPDGTYGYAIHPFATLPAGTKTLQFELAAAQYNDNGNPFGNDKLEVVYSTNCGTSWTSLWSKSGALLATAAPDANLFVPTTNSQWRQELVDLTSVPDGAQIAFKATSGYGNSILVDNVMLKSGLSINQWVNDADINVYPNPVTNAVNVKFNANQAFDATLEIVNVTGQVVSQQAYKVITGTNNASVNTEKLAAGTYFLNIKSIDGTLTRKFVKQ